MFKSSCSALYCSLLRVLHFVHFLLNDGRSWKYHSAVWPLCQFRGKKIAAGIPVITNFLLKKEWWIIRKARFLSRSTEGADVYKEKILQHSKAKRSGSIREHSRSKMVWSCLDFDKHEQNVSTLSYYSISKCMCLLWVCVEIILHVNTGPAVHHYYCLCQHVNIARHQSCTQHKWTELLC